MFKKILIANRGEIACRIIRTAKRLGVATVAVYSEADRNALHVAMADEAVAIGPAPAAQSYLNIDAILEACARSGAEAVHPGYGFLSERAAFARALDSRGVVFIGPNAAAIAAMGDKIESKKAAHAARVSTVPGFLGVIADAEHAVRIAEEIGFPVMLKASAGGGGKGMRVAQTSGEVAEGFERARSEAAASFGDDRMFIEKFIVDPRHIEIQVLGDKHGAVVYLGERECSVQRRNQKVLEEAPSPLLDEATRQAMGEQAVALAKAVGYDSAGTVEFVAAQDKSFYFLEMNTRLQVEHPVTELVTGLDLVEQMIRIADGEPLAFKQADVTMRGWAVESRIYAEDPSRGFLPSTGRLTTYRPPAAGTSDAAVTRVDGGVEEGGEISIYYDPMIAKLVTHAPDRAAAVEAHARALDEFVIEGIRHNVPFLSALMALPRWKSGALSTGLIAEEFPQGFVTRAVEGADALTLACVAAAVDHTLNRRKRLISGQLRTRDPIVFLRDRTVLLGDARHDVRVEEDGDEIILRFESEAAAPRRIVSGWTPLEPVWRGQVDGESVSCRAKPILNGVELSWRGMTVAARVYTRREAALAALTPPRRKDDATKTLVCPMPGLVKALFVKPGDAVGAGDPLCIVEAMKMENVLRAERDGVVKSLFCAVGESLAVDAAILEFA